MKVSSPFSLMIEGGRIAQKYPKEVLCVCSSLLNGKQAQVV